MSNIDDIVGNLRRKAQQHASVSKLEKDAAQKQSTMEQWSRFVIETVKTYATAREQHLELILSEPFDHQAHSTRVTVGTKVAFTKKFLKSIGCSSIDKMWFARGVVVEITWFGQEPNEVRLTEVEWQPLGDEIFPQKVNIVNLAPVGPNLKFCGD